MKVHLKKGLAGYTGKADGAVYYYHPKLKLCLARNYVVPNNKRNTDRHKAIMANLKLLNPSQPYKNNFNDYLLAYNNHKDYRDRPMLSWNNLFLKMMFALQKAMPESVDLKTISREQIFAQDLPCKTLKSAIEAGLLPKLKGWENWDKEI